jgi:peptide/nickel transport system substrate-binding protein
MKYRISVLCAALALTAGGIQAKTFKWTSASDIPTWDIHSQNNALANGVHAAVYESLVYYNSRTFKPEPVLATDWKQVTPTQLRMTLRKGVKFHDGASFSADDAAFSIERAMSKTSNFAVYTQGIDRVVKVDANTIDIFTKDPNPVLLNQLTELRMMSKAWAEKNNSVAQHRLVGQDGRQCHRDCVHTGESRGHAHGRVAVGRGGLCARSQPARPAPCAF